MKINIASDLHLETYEWFPKFSPQKVYSLSKDLFDCDALVLTWRYRKRSVNALRVAGDLFRPRRLYPR